MQGNKYHSEHFYFLFSKCSLLKIRPSAVALARRTLPSTPETDLRNMAPTCPQTWYYAMCRPLPPRYFTVFSGVSLLRTCCPYISLAYAPYDPHLALARTCPQHGPRWPQHGFNPGPFPPPPLASGRLPGSLSIHPKLPPKSTHPSIRSRHGRRQRQRQERRQDTAQGRRHGRRTPAHEPRGEPREKPMEAADSFKKHDISMET